MTNPNIPDFTSNFVPVKATPPAPLRPEPRPILEKVAFYNNIAIKEATSEEKTIEEIKAADKKPSLNKWMVKRAIAMEEENTKG